MADELPFLIMTSYIKETIPTRNAGINHNGYLEKIEGL